MRQTKNHQGISVTQFETTPAYADPEFENDNSRNHDVSWDRPPSPMGGGSNGGDGGEQEREEESPDHIFEGAGGPPSIVLTALGEENENGPRIPYPRELERANFDAQRGEFKDGKYENRWYPYNSRQQFRMARRNVFPRIPTKDSIQANLVGRLSDRLHPAEQTRRFSNINHFMSSLDLIARKITPWSEATLTIHGTDQQYKIRYRNTLDVLQELIGDVIIDSTMTWAPIR